MGVGAVLAAGLIPVDRGQFYPWLLRAWVSPPEICETSRVAHEFQLDQCKNFADKRLLWLSVSLAPWLLALGVTLALRDAMRGFYRRGRAAVQNKASSLGIEELLELHAGRKSWLERLLGLKAYRARLSTKKEIVFVVPISAPDFSRGQKVELFAIGSFWGRSFVTAKLHAPQMAIVGRIG